MKLVETAKIIGVNNPADMSSTAMTAKYVSLKNYDHLTIIIHTGAWAAGTAAVTLLQATNVSAGSATGLGMDYMWTGTVASGLLTKTAVTSDTFNLSVANSLYVIEIDADELDVDNGFDCVTLAVASPGANSDFYNVDYILTEPRYAQATPPSAITD
ncbi:MAG: hypothetical protein WC683_12575 [bacterium]